MKIFKEGEFKYNLEYGGEVYVYSVGGVDFSKHPKKNITRVQLRRREPRPAADHRPLEDRPA